MRTRAGSAIAAATLASRASAKSFDKKTSRANIHTSIINELFSANNSYTTPVFNLNGHSMQPQNPIAAVTHPDPYPYYDTLLARAPLHFDRELGAWVASRAAVIEEVLGHPECRVRPCAEPVPKAIAASGAGDVFARLIRMNDGAAHASGKRIVGRALAGIEPTTTLACVSEAAEVLARHHDLADAVGLTRWIFDLPTWAVARLLGFERTDLSEIVSLTRDFVQCLSPLSGPAQLNRAGVAAFELHARFGKLLNGKRRSGTLLDQLTHEAWLDRDAMIANLVGLLSQTHEATAGLIGNSVVRLMRETQSSANAVAAPLIAAATVREVMRLDPPIQNTRRFVGAASMIAGQELHSGDLIVLVLAADRHDPTALGFGHGGHACPGQALALGIATGAVSYLLATGQLPDRESCRWHYRPSDNARLPLFYSLPPKATP